jgi:hypothetical protein
VSIAPGDRGLGEHRGPGGLDRRQGIAYKAGDDSGVQISMESCISESHPDDRLQMVCSLLARGYATSRKDKADKYRAAARYFEQRRPIKQPSKPAPEVKQA